MTDNAANMKKAFQLPGYEVDPLEEEQDENGDDLTEDEEWMSELESQIPKRGSCGANTLQLVVKDGYRLELVLIQQVVCMLFAGSQLTISLQACIIKLCA